MRKADEPLGVTQTAGVFLEASRRHASAPKQTAYEIEVASSQTVSAPATDIGTAEKMQSGINSIKLNMQAKN